MVRLVQWDYIFFLFFSCFCHIRYLTLHGRNFTEEDLEMRILERNRMSIRGCSYIMSAKEGGGGGRPNADIR